MTKKEEQTINKLFNLLQEIKTENAKLCNAIETINKKTEKKHVPITLEQDILKTAQIAINESIQKVLTEYNSPLKKLTETVIS